MERDEGRKYLYTRWTMKSADQSVIPEFEEKTEAMGYASRYKTKGADLVHPNGSILFRGILTSSGNQIASLKSIPGLTDWIMDEGQEMPRVDEYDTINLSLRQKGLHNRIVIPYNPTDVTHWLYQNFYKDKGPLDRDGKPTDIPDGFNGVVGRVRYIDATYLDNLTNLDKDFIAEADEMKATNLAKYNHLFLGHWLQDLAGALWTHAMVKKAKELIIEDDTLEVIAIGVDPNVSSSGDQDDAGLVAAGRTADGFYKVLLDRSGQHTPAEWAKMAIRMYIKCDADWIVAEVNKGGDLVEMTLRNMAGDPIFDNAGFDPESIPIEKVRATKGKLLRAEPIATLYERGRVSHADGLEDLELELMTYTGDGKKSPGRLDALVWVITQLMTVNTPQIRQV